MINYSEDQEKLYHLQVGKGDVGRYVILPGDPKRCAKIAKYLDDARLIADSREFVTYTGTLDGEKVSVTSTGIGGPSASIAMEELVMAGADTFVRIGTCGGMQLDVMGGDLVIATAAVRAEGTSWEYLPEGYPAAADFEVVCALRDAAKGLSTGEEGNRFHVGVIHSKDSFYGEVYPDTMPVAAMLNDKWKGYLQCGCLASEMEAAALFSVGLVRRVRVGAVITALWNVERSNKGLSDPVCNDNTRAIRCSVEAIRLLIKRDKQKG